MILTSEGGIEKMLVDVSADLIGTGKHKNIGNRDVFESQAGNPMEPIILPDYAD